MTDPDSAAYPIPDRPFPAALLETAPRAVPPDWIDYNGHMNVGYYGLAFDQALDEIYDDWLGMGAAYVEATGMGPFSIQQHLHYLAELREGERFFVRWQLLDWDAKRTHFMSTLWALPNAAGAEPTLSATAEQISMNVDLTARRSAPYPPAYQARLRAAAEAHAALPRPAQTGQPLGIRRR